MCVLAWLASVATRSFSYISHPSVERHPALAPAPSAHRPCAHLLPLRSNRFSERTGQKVIRAHFQDRVAVSFPISRAWVSGLTPENCDRGERKTERVRKKATIVPGNFDDLRECSSILVVSSFLSVNLLRRNLRNDNFAMRYWRAVSIEHDYGIWSVAFFLVSSTYGLRGRKFLSPKIQRVSKASGWQAIVPARCS